MRADGRLDRSERRVAVDDGHKTSRRRQFTVDAMTADETFKLSLRVVDTLNSCTSEAGLRFSSSHALLWRDVTQPPERCDIYTPNNQSCLIYSPKRLLADSFILIVCCTEMFYRLIKVNGRRAIPEPKFFHAPANSTPKCLTTLTGRLTRSPRWVLLLGRRPSTTGGGVDGQFRSFAICPGSFLICLSVCLSAREIAEKLLTDWGNIYSDSRLGPTQETIGVKFSSQNSTTDNFLSATKFKVITFLFIYLFYLMNLLASINISITIRQENTGQMANTGYNHLRVANAVN